MRLFRPLESFKTSDDAEEAGDDKDDEYDALVQLSGVVRGRSFAAAKDTVAAALSNLREDLAKTVERRLVLLLEEMGEEEDADPRAPMPTGAAHAWAMPRRAHFDVGDGLSLCDYVADGEEASDFVDKVAEIVGEQVCVWRGTPAMGMTWLADGDRLNWSLHGQAPCATAMDGCMLIVRSPARAPSTVSSRSLPSPCHSFLHR